MQVSLTRSCVIAGVVVAACMLARAQGAPAPQSSQQGAPAPQNGIQVWTWEQLRDRLQLSNPTLLADKLNIDESKAEEITAFLRPNPSFNISVDGTQIAPHDGVWRPFAGTYETPGLSYLHERRHKRELRLESAQKATGIAVSSQADLERNLIFTLRSAFVGTLQAKAVLRLAE